MINWSLIAGFIIGLAPGVWFVWQWFSREDAEHRSLTEMEIELTAANTLIEKQKHQLKQLQLQKVTLEQQLSSMRLHQQEEPAKSNVHHLPVYRTSAAPPEPDKVYCKDCIWYEQFTYSANETCAKGPQVESPIRGIYRQRRSGKTTNASFDCPDFEAGDPFEASAQEKRRQAGVR